MSKSATVERLTPEEAFGLLGNETRLGILRALVEATREESTPVSFSELRERVGTRDSGQFNYHLGKLVGHFVRHVADEEATDGRRSARGGYELTLAGQQVVGALLAGTYTADATLDPVEIDDPCPNCGEGAIVATYDDEFARVECRACEVWFNEFPFPPGTVEQYDPEELPGAFDRWLRAGFDRLLAGFCDTCGGRVDGRLVSADPDEWLNPVRAEFRCERCGSVSSASVAIAVRSHPAATGFYYDHGIDVTTDPSWSVSNRTTDVDVEVLGEDPVRARVTVTVDGDRLAAEVDEDLRIVAVDRSDR